MIYLNQGRWWTTPEISQAQNVIITWLSAPDQHVQTTKELLVHQEGQQIWTFQRYACPEDWGSLQLQGPKLLSIEYIW